MAVFLRFSTEESRENGTTDYEHRKWPGVILRPLKRHHLKPFAAGSQCAKKAKRRRSLLDKGDNVAGNVGGIQPKGSIEIRTGTGGVVTRLPPFC